MIKALSTVWDMEQVLGNHGLQPPAKKQAPAHGAQRACAPPPRLHGHSLIGLPPCLCLCHTAQFQTPISGSPF
jgi:hypothetical protein